MCVGLSPPAPCTLKQAATYALLLQMWRGAPEQLVGWFDRHVCRKHNGDFQYIMPDDVDSMPHYSIVLTKAAVMHRRYLAAYTAQSCLSECVILWQRTGTAKTQRCSS